MANLQTLQSRSALASALDSSRATVSLEVIEGNTVAHLAARKGHAAGLISAFEAAYGVRLPQSPSIVTKAGLSAVWAGPEQWLVFASNAGGRDLEAELRTKFGAVASVADQSDARTFVRISGSASRATLAKGLAIDVHPRAFPAGAAAITHASHIGCMVWRPDAGASDDCFMLTCSRSYAGSFWHWLTESAAEFGVTVA